MALKQWRQTGRKLICQGRLFRYFQVESQTQSGHLKGTFDVLESLDWVNVVAVTPEQKLVAIRQYRQGSENITLEIPGGAVDPGEDFLTAARRELCEETGYTSTRWKLIGEVSPNPAFMNNTCQTFLAENCILSDSTNFDPLEEIETQLIDVAKVPEMVRTGKINHSLVVAALHFWTLNR